MPNEFLFLMCNAKNRLDTITSLHNPIFKSNMTEIYQWELSDGKPISHMVKNG
jgi:hypothetical protein